MLVHLHCRNYQPKWQHSPPHWRKEKKENSNCAKLSFPVLTLANKLEPMQHIYALGFLERVRLFLVVSQSQQQHPTSELAYGLSTVPSKYFYLRDVMWEHLGAVTSRRIQFWVLKGFSKCVLHMLRLKLFATELLHNSASCKWRALFARTCLTPPLKYYMQPFLHFRKDTGKLERKQNFAVWGRKKILNQ